MRRRLTVAMLAVVIGTLVLTLVGSVLLVRRAALSSAEDGLTTQADAIGELLSNRTSVLTDSRVLQVLRRVGSFDFLAPVGLSPVGTFTTLPAPLGAGVTDVSALQADQTVAGNVGDVVFVARPISLTNAQRRSLGGIPTGDLPVLIVTSTVHNPVNPVPYFVLVAVVVLVVGAVVAALVARRMSAPMRRAVDVTSRMAEGDLAATLPVSGRDPPELQELARAINRMGESLARARDHERQFLLSVSHDLRTPLTSIRGYAEALSEGAADDPAAALAVIAGEAQRLERLVQDLLDLARIDASRFSLALQPVDLAEVVRDTAEAFAPEAQTAAVVLTTAAEPGTWVDGDLDRLRQLAGNLVDNALRFARSRVEMAARADTSWCELSVADDGPGIADEDRHKVFERHFSAEGVGDNRRGSGLGLAIVAELAHAMGGDARAEQTDAGGTRMVVRLPRRR